MPSNKKRKPRINDKLYFVFPDIHFGAEDKTALAVAMKAHAHLRPGHTIQLGDMLDCDVFSSHGRRSIDEMRITSYFEDEVSPARNFIKQCLENSNHIQLLEGNHENRIERWCANAGLLGITLYDAINPKDTLLEGMPKGRVGWTPYVNTREPTSFYRIAEDLVAVHGWSAAKQAAQVHLDAARTSSVVFGHTHRHQVATTRDSFSGRIYKSFNPGTLSRLQPIYMHGGKPTEWTHGFALIYVGADSWTEYCVTINRDICVLPDGTQIRA